MSAEPGAERKAGGFEAGSVRRHFAILNHDLAWLDNAATTQRPESVLKAMDQFYRQRNANTRRSVHRLGAEATAAYEGARAAVATFVGAATPDEIVFTSGTTASINLAVDYTDPKRNLMDSVITFRYFTEKEDSVNPAFSGQYQPKEFDWLAFKQNQTVWQQTLSAAPTLYWSNHDMARLATRVAKTPVQQRSLAMAMYLERGIPVIYYGEELGLHNLEFDNADQFADETVADFVKEAGEAGVDEKTALEMASQTQMKIIIALALLSKRFEGPK